MQQYATASTSSQSPPYSRQARGSYAKFICLNCRARKIKCVLPSETADFEPSSAPQPPETSCTRCRQQGLDCVVDRTVLGRPATKRRRPEPMYYSVEQPDVKHSVEQDDDEVDPDSAGVQAFVLSDVGTAVNDIDDRLGTPTRPNPSKPEIFSALVDSTKLFSALMARDARFGTAGIGLHASSLGGLLTLVGADMAAKMDANLVWHRLFHPYIPSIPSLRQELSHTRDDESPPLATEALLALLCLIAIEVKSPHFQAPEAVWQQFKSLVSSYGQEILFNLPVHRHALWFLELCDYYQPLVFVNRQGSAAAAIKGSLTTTLGKRTALELELDKASGRLDELLQQPRRSRDYVIESLVVDALQWCRWLVLQHLVDPYVVKPIQEQRQPLPQLKAMHCTLRKAVEQYRMTPGVIYLFHVTSGCEIDMQAAVTCKQNWLNISMLETLMTTHRESCVEQENYLTSLLSNCNTINNPSAVEEIKAITQLRAIDLNISHIRITGLSLFYSLMSGLHPPAASSPRPHDVTPDDAVQIGNQIVSYLKKLRQGDTVSGDVNFLVRYADARVKRQEQSLHNFVTAADKLQLAGVPLVPPAIETVSCLLYCCRDLVENNATMLRGFGKMNPNVDVHLLLFQDVAKRLDGMDFLGGGPEAVTRGSVYAAGAKLVKSLCSIIAGWRKGMAGKEVKEAVARGAGSQSVESFEGLEQFLEGELFDDWSKWPQSHDLDFSELFADGTEWVSWANGVLPAEGSR